MAGVHLVVVSGWPGAGKSTIADRLGAALPATVVGFDWVMSALRTFPEVWDQLEQSVDRLRDVGWTLMSRVAEQQMRRGASVVFDVVAREPAISQWRRLADRYGARLSVIECFCEDQDLHRARIEGRERGIPGWYELTWDQVLRTRADYVPIHAELALVLDAGDPLEANVARALDWLRAR